MIPTLGRTITLNSNHEITPLEKGIYKILGKSLTQIAWRWFEPLSSHARKESFVCFADPSRECAYDTLVGMQFNSTFRQLPTDIINCIIDFTFVSPDLQEKRCQLKYSIDVNRTFIFLHQLGQTQLDDSVDPVWLPSDLEDFWHLHWSKRLRSKLQLERRDSLVEDMMDILVNQLPFVFDDGDGDYGLISRVDAPFQIDAHQLQLFKEWCEFIR